MKHKNEWMLMTYYCPTHGDPGRIQPIEITRREIKDTFAEKAKFQQNNLII